MFDAATRLVADDDDALLRTDEDELLRVAADAVEELLRAADAEPLRTPEVVRTAVGVLPEAELLRADVLPPVLLTGVMVPVLLPDLVDEALRLATVVPLLTLELVVPMPSPLETPLLDRLPAPLDHPPNPYSPLS